MCIFAWLAVRKAFTCINTSILSLAASTIEYNQLCVCVVTEWTQSLCPPFLDNVFHTGTVTDVIYYMRKNIDALETHFHCLLHFFFVL